MATSRPRARALRATSTLLAILALSACSNPTDSEPPLNRYGAVEIRAQSTSATTARATATAIFFSAYTLAVPNSATMQKEACAALAVDTASGLPQGDKPAGTNVALTVGSNSLTLPYEAANFRYATPAASPFQYQAGESIQASIPGAPDAFPAASINVKLAEPVVPGAITLPAAGQPLVITWNATNDPSVAILLYLRYANPASTSFANEQIYCQLNDDGRHEIASSSLGSFLASPSARRSLLIRRYRTNESLIDSRTLLHIATYADSTVRF